MTPEDDPPLRLVLLDGTEAPEPPEAAVPPPEPAPLELDLAPRPRPVTALPPATAAPTPPPPEPAFPRHAAAMTLPVIATLVAVLASLLPERRRGWAVQMNVPLVRGTILGGIAQTGLGVLLFATGYGAYKARIANEALAWMTRHAIDRGDLSNTDFMGTGLTVYFGYLFSATGLVTLFAAFEGVLRSAGAGLAQEPIGTAPLWLLDVAASALGDGLTRLRRGRPVPDEVRGDASGALHIACWGAQPWSVGTVVVKDDAFFKVVAITRLRRGPRQFVYELGPLERGETVRAPRRYSS